MKSILRVSGFLLVFLFSISTVSAFDVEHDGASIIVTNQSPQVELVLSKVGGTLSFNLKTDRITLSLLKSIDEEDGRLFVRCLSNSTGNVVTFTNNEYAIFSLLLAKVDFSQWDEEYNKFLYTSLNLLESWPSNTLVFTAMDPEKILYYQLDGTLGILPNQPGVTLEGYIPPSGKELNYPVSACDNLCFQKGEFIEGDILYLGGDISIFDREAWTEPFSRYVDSDPCFGRCGKGCPDNLEGRITYTQRCFNHDGCVDECGYLAENCVVMFFGCTYDYAFAPVCYEIWVSSYKE